MEYAYGRSGRRLDQEDFGPDCHDLVLEAGKWASLLKQMIWIWHLMQSLPEWMVVLLSPGFDLALRNQRVSCQHSNVHHMATIDIFFIANRKTNRSNQGSTSINFFRFGSSNTFPRNPTE